MYIHTYAKNFTPWKHVIVHKLRHYRFLNCAALLRTRTYLGENLLARKIIVSRLRWVGSKVIASSSHLDIEFPDSVSFAAGLLLLLQPPDSLFPRLIVRLVQLHHDPPDSLQTLLFEIAVLVGPTVLAVNILQPTNGIA